MRLNFHRVENVVITINTFFSHNIFESIFYGHRHCDVKGGGGVQRNLKLRPSTISVGKAEVP